MAAKPRWAGRMMHASWWSGFLTGFSLLVLALIFHISIYSPRESLEQQYTRSLQNRVLSKATSALSSDPIERDRPSSGGLASNNYNVGELDHLKRRQMVAFNDYVKMYGRQPPRGFDKWVEYAASRLCRFDQGAYAMMEDSLAPFRKNRPKSSLVRAAFEKLDNAALISVRNGVVSGFDAKGPVNNSEFYYNKIMEFAPHVPDLDLITNSLDEPRVWWPEPLAAELEEQISKGLLTVNEAFGEHGCRATYELQKWRDLHAFVVSPRKDRVVIHEQAPVASFSGIPGCFADFRLPNHMSVPHHGECSPSEYGNSIPWGEKIPKLYWRGTNTGSSNNVSDSPREKALKFHRNRLIAWAKKHGSDKYDIGFTGLVQGDGHLSLELMGGQLLPSQSASEAFKHKYLLVIDGNAAATRLTPFLCSSSLVFLVQGMDEWFYDRIKPWIHYIPVALDFSDLEERVQWALDNEWEAQAIVRRANRAVRQETRQEDMDCYWFRFLLEYGSLMEVDT